MKKFQKITIFLLVLIFLLQGTGLGFLAQAQSIPEFNKNILRETQRLDPLLIFSNTAPRDFNERMAQAISDALGVNIYEIISAEEWEALIQESLRISQEETFKELLRRVKEIISQKSRQKIVSEIDQILQATPTEHAKKVAKKEFAKSLDRTLQTDWDPVLEKFIVENAAAILAKVLADSNAAFLLNPKFYWYIYETLDKFLKTKIEDLPLLSDLVSAKLVEHIPGANILTDVNDFIDTQRENLKVMIATEAHTRIAQPISRAIFKTISGIFPDWLGGFLEVLEAATNEILRQAIEEYVDMYITKTLRDHFWVGYNFKNQLAEWVNLTLKDVLPLKTQRDLEKTLFETIPPDAQDFFIDVMAIARAIAEALTTPREEVERETAKKVLDILFPGLEELFKKTLYQLLCTKDVVYIPEVVEFCQKGVWDLPEEFTKPLISFVPGANTAIVDLLLPQYSDLLKTRLLDYLPEEEKNLLTKPLKDLSEEEMEKLKGYILGNRSLLSLMSGEAQNALTKTLLEMMDNDTQSLLKKTFREHLPEAFQKTPFSLAGVDPRKPLLSYMSEDVQIFVDLIYQYIPDAKQREWINPVLNTLKGTIKDLIANETTAFSLGLGKPEAAEILDTSFIELLTIGDLRDQLISRELTDETEEYSIIELIQKQFDALGLAEKLKMKIEESGASQDTQQLLTEKLGDLSTTSLRTISQNVRNNRTIKQILSDDPKADKDIITGWDELKQTDYLLYRALNDGLGDILENNLRKALRKSPLQILDDATGQENLLETSVLDYLKSADPNVHKAITTGLGDLLGEYVVGQILNNNISEENQEKSVLLIIGEKLYGPPLKEEIEKKIEETGLTGTAKEILLENLGSLHLLDLATLWQKIIQGKSIISIMQEAPYLDKLNLPKLKNTNPDLYGALTQPIQSFLHSNIIDQIQHNELTEENKNKSITLLIAENIAGPKLETQLNKSPIDFIPFLSKTIFEIIDESLPSAQEISSKIKDRLTAAQISPTTLNLLTKPTGQLTAEEKGDLWNILTKGTGEDLRFQSLQEIVKKEDGNVEKLGLGKIGVTELKISYGITTGLNEFLPGSLILQIWDKEEIAPTYKGKSIIDFIGDSLARFSFSGTLKKNFLDFLPEKVSKVLQLTYGGLLKEIWFNEVNVFDTPILELLPKEWQKTIKDLFGLTDSDIEQAIKKAMEEVEDEIASVLQRNLAWAARTMTQITAFVFNEKLAEKIGANVLSEENMKKISENITKEMEPLIEKAIIEPIHKGYLINTLYDIYLGP